MSEQSENLKELSYKQRVFVEAYLEGWNATRAAAAAGYVNPKQQGSRLLTYVDIQAEIDKRLSEMAMSANEVLARLSEQAEVNIGEFVKKEILIDDDGHEDYVIRLDWDMVKDKGHLIKKITHNNFGPIIELHDGQAALVHIGRYHKLFTDKVEATGKDGADLIPKVSDAEHHRSMLSLSNVIRKSISDQVSEPDDVMGTTK